MKYFKDENVRKNLFTGGCLILLFFLIYNIKYIWNAAGRLLDVFVPFIVGAAIAFVLNVPMRWIEKGLFKNREKYSGPGWDKARRVLAIIITILLTFLIITLLLYAVIPQLAETITQLVKQIPEGVRQITAWANKQFSEEPFIQQTISDLANDWQNILQKLFGILKNAVNTALESGINVITGVVSGVLNFFIGFIFSIYVLMNKEKLGDQATKITYAMFNRKRADEILAVGRLTSKTFANFISGQCVEAVILASMFCVTMTILGLPYAMLIGVLIGVMNLIPIVGAFIGCFIGVFLIILVDPVKALVFFIVFLVLQQIENNLIYPKVVGNSVGLPGLWVLMSVTVGGSLFGVKGMVCFIPLISVCYSLFRRYIYTRLRNKKLVDPEGYELTPGIGDVQEIETHRPEEDEELKKRGFKLKLRRKDSEQSSNEQNS